MVNAAQLQAAVQEALLAQRAALQAENALQIQNAVQAAIAAQQQQPPPAPEGYSSPYNTPPSDPDPRTVFGHGRGCSSDSGSGPVAPITQGNTAAVGDD